MLCITGVLRFSAQHFQHFSCTHGQPETAFVFLCIAHLSCNDTCLLTRSNQRRCSPVFNEARKNWPQLASQHNDSFFCRSKKCLTLQSRLTHLASPHVELTSSVFASPERRVRRSGTFFFSSGPCVLTFFKQPPYSKKSRSFFPNANPRSSHFSLWVQYNALLHCESHQGCLPLSTCAAVGQQFLEGSTERLSASLCDGARHSAAAPPTCLLFVDSGMMIEIRTADALCMFRKRSSKKLCQTPHVQEET